MAEAEELIADAARHATVFARDLWRRHRQGAVGPPATALRDVAERLGLLLEAVFGRSHPLHVATVPAPATFLTQVFRRREGPRVDEAVPSTDGVRIWLPASLEDQPGHPAAEQFRIMALQQAMRARRGGPARWAALPDPLERAAFLVLEANAADAALAAWLPGLRARLETARRLALAARPGLQRFPPSRRAVEALVREALSTPLDRVPPLPADEVAALAREHARRLRGSVEGRARRLLYRDRWLGEFAMARADGAGLAEGAGEDAHADERAPRSARLARPPTVREAPPDEEEGTPGAWMVQTSQPHEQAEDPLGLQRPTDRDASTAAEELADALSELPQARLVSTPGRPKEVLLSDEPPPARARQADPGAASGETVFRYPEWDCRLAAYRENAVAVHLRPADEGPREWVERTLEAHRAMLHLVRRRFEMLKAQRVRLRKQLDGDDVDLEAYIDARADFRAGLPMPQALYQVHREARRDTAILVLVDVSGSTDGWISAGRRVIDVEREALLLVSIALQGMGEPYAVQAFSGEGPLGVVVRSIKSFDEAFGDTVGRRIASLEPEHYTRAGAAIRHATAGLMVPVARHRLLLLLSDGKPNDIDRYEGRYGIEDTRQAVTEARLQGVNVFCLTVDRQASQYLPAVFGAHQYALLPRPERLPTVLLEWMSRLVKQ